MKRFSINGSLAALACSFASLVSVESCKKKDTSPSTNFTANINGVQFNGSNAQGAYSDDVILIRAHNSTGDGATLIVGFPFSSQAPTTFPTNGDNSAIGFQENGTSGNIYQSDPSKNARGTITLNSFNKIDSTVSGTFSGKIINSNGKIDSVGNGSFSIKFARRRVNFINPFSF